MKRIIIILILISVSISAHPQINPGLGIVDYESCNLESYCGLLKMDTSSQNIWQIGKPMKVFFDTAYSIPNALVTDTLNPYPVSNHSYFDLVIRNFYYLDMIVSFRHKFQTDTLTDGGYIELSYDMGQSWENILYDSSYIFFYSENLYTTDDTLKGGINGFSGTSNGWINTRVEWIWALPIKFYPPDTLMMRFHFISDSIQTNKAGWMIDNILISYAMLPGAVNEINYGVIPLEIYPNPFDTYTNIQFENPRNEDLEIWVLNPLGQVVRTIKDITGDQIRIEKEDLTSGMYFVQLRKDWKLLANQKLIVK